MKKVDTHACTFDRDVGMDLFGFHGLLNLYIYIHTIFIGISRHID